MDRAEKRIRALLQEATAYRDMSSALPPQKTPTMSGMCPEVYPLLAPPLRSGSALQVVSAMDIVPLPQELLDHFDPMQNSHCMMGAFPEISQAWLIIDNHLFLWNFLNGRNLYHFDGVKDTILCAGLVRPREGLLQPHISYLLVIATPVQVVTLGVISRRLRTEAFQDIQLLEEPLYSVAAEDTYVSVAGTHNGRVFLSGQYGCLNEVVYQAKAGWLSPKCWIENRSKSAVSVLVASMLSGRDDPMVQIAVDNGRNVLYTRSESGRLQVYDLGPDGNGINKVASLSQDTIVSAAVDIAKTVDPSIFTPIVQIAVIEKSESVNCHLVAVTHAGVRLYFTIAPLHPPAAQPCRMSLLHIRLPPGFTASAAVEKPSNVHKALYSDGVFLMAATKDGTNNDLWCINHDHIPFRKSLIETHAVVRVTGHACAIASVPDSSVRMEHLVPTKTFVVLSAVGIHIFHMVRPVEQLRHLLVSTYESAGEQDIERFFKMYHQDQACVASLHLACANAATDRQLSVWAKWALFRYGGTAKVKNNPSPPAPKNIRKVSASPGPVQSPGNSCSQAPNPNLPASLQPHSPEILFSGRHNAVYIYFTCIIKSIWDKKTSVGRKLMIENREFTEIHSRLSADVLESVLSDLTALQEFLDKNFEIGTSFLRDRRAVYESTIPRNNRVTTGPRRNRSGRTCNVHNRDVNIGRHQESYSTEAHLEEKTSLQGIHQLVTRTVQTLVFWRLLCGPLFHQVVSGLDMGLQEQLRKITFKDLVIRDKELTRALISSLIRCHIQCKVEVDTVTSYLRQKCPLLYNAEDIALAKANAYLQRSLQAEHKNEKEQALRASLREYRKVCRLIDLAAVCDQYTQEHFYEGVVELCLTSAEEKDPHGLGLQFLKNGKPMEDESGFQAYEDKMCSFRIIIHLLQELLNQRKPAPPRLPANQDPSLQQRCAGNDQFGQILDRVQRSSDEFFHIVLFNWLLGDGLTDMLLELKSPFLESHLWRLSNHDKNEVYYLNLIWRYHVRKGNHMTAARVLFRLADTSNTNMPLNVRVDYLTRAVLSARATNVTAEDIEFVHGLQDTMDVAKIQLQIQEMLVRKCSHIASSQEAAAQLDAQVMGLTDLYEKFAHPFQLSEGKLAIIKCASFSDVLLVQSIWKEIIQRELKDSINMAAADRMQLLNLKLISLGKVYASAPLCFPLQFLVQYLEQQVCSLDWHVGFVSNTMMEMNVPLPRLFAAYDHLFRLRDPFWTEMKKPFHLLQRIHDLLSGYVDDLSKVSSFERQQFTTTCLNAVSSYVAELQSMDPTPAVKSSIWTLKHLKTRLEQVPRFRVE